MDSQGHDLLEHGLSGRTMQPQSNCLQVVNIQAFTNNITKNETLKIKRISGNLAHHTTCGCVQVKVQNGNCHKDCKYGLKRWNHC